MEKKALKRVIPKLSKTFGRIKEPEQDWLEMFNNFLDNTDHVMSEHGKFYEVKNGKKGKEIKVVKNEVQKKTSHNRRNTLV